MRYHLTVEEFLKELDHRFLTEAPVLRWYFQKFREEDTGRVFYNKDGYSLDGTFLAMESHVYYSKSTRDSIRSLHGGSLMLHMRIAILGSIIDLPGLLPHTLEWSYVRSFAQWFFQGLTDEEFYELTITHPQIQRFSHLWQEEATRRNSNANTTIGPTR